jgi:hypothetical protein
VRSTQIRALPSRTSATPAGSGSAYSAYASSSTHSTLCGKRLDEAPDLVAATSVPVGLFGFAT